MIRRESGVEFGLIEDRRSVRRDSRACKIFLIPLESIGETTRRPRAEIERNEQDDDGTDGYSNNAKRRDDRSPNGNSGAGA